MKISSILIIGLLMLFGLLNGQKSKVDGAWQLYKVEVGDQVIENLKSVYIFDDEGVLKASRSAAGDVFSVGTWTYDQNENLLIMRSTLDKDFNGKTSVLRVNEENLVLKKAEATLYFKRVIIKVKVKAAPSVVIEKLDFTMEDFFDKDGEYKYYDDEEKLPWNDPQKMVQSMADVNQLVYHYLQINADGEKEEDKILTADVEANVEESSLNIDFIFYGYDKYDLPDDTGLPPSAKCGDSLFPEKDNVFRIAGNEQIITPAGTFDCTVIEVSGEFDECRKLWMVTGKPGVYAKIVVEKLGDWGYSSVYQLQAIK